MVRDIVNGVLFTSLIFFISVFIPIIGFFGALIIPLPILFYRLKLGRTIGVLIPVISGLLLFILIGGISPDILFFVELLVIGFILGELIESNHSIEKTILYATGAVWISGLTGLTVYSTLSGDSIYAVVSAYVTKNLELTMVLYQNMGMSDENIALIDRFLLEIRPFIVQIIPAMVTASTLFVAWTNLLIARPLLKSRSLSSPDFGPLNMWKAPEFLVWAVIGCGLALFIPVAIIKSIGINGLLILMTVYFFQGIAIVAFYFEKKRFPRMVRFFLYTLIALQHLILLAVIGLGFFDMWINFRRSGKQTG
ncbi:MAG: YybS family protein [Deltaproteobacteria bacterium]|jgi:uncharacterized protein YybS (DUF2232 family)|nr:YybS family protein [Deltaproteobacteria bacterium]